MKITEIQVAAKNTDTAVSILFYSGDACTVLGSSIPESRVFGSRRFIAPITDKHEQAHKESVLDAWKSVEGANVDCTLITARWPDGKFGMMAFRSDAKTAIEM